MIALIPDNESKRLEALRDFSILDTGPEPGFDDITALAAQICRTPIALITFVDETRQWFKSKVGLELDSTSRDVAFCAHALAGSELLVVPDARGDARFADNPLVTGEPQIRFYAGAPLVALGGGTIGTLCVIDREPRELDELQLFALRVLGQQVMTRLQLRREVMDLSRTEKALRASEGKYRQLAEQLTAAQAVGNVGSWETDVETGEITWSVQAHRIFETDPDTFTPTHRGFLKFVHPEDRRAVDEAYVASLGRQQPCSLEHRILMPDGRVKHIEERWQIFLGGEHESPRAIGTCQDISGRRQAEDERDRLFELSLDMLCVAGFDGWLQQVNPAWTRCLGWTADELTSRPMRDFIHPDDREATIRMREAITQGSPARGFENRYRCRDGSYRWFSWSVHPLPETRQVFAVARDITGQKQAEAKILRLNRLYAVSSGINEAIVRIRQAQELYEQACRIAVERGGFVMAWVGLAATDEDVIEPVAHWGREDGYLELIRITTNPDQLVGRGPAGQAFRSGNPACCDDIAAAADTFASRDEALRRGYGSCAVFPLKLEGRSIGILSVYGDQAGYFGEEEIQLLNALAENISFAVESQQREQRRREAEGALHASEATMAAAQRIGHFGSWEMELTGLAEDTAHPLHWSDEMFRLAGFEPGACEVTDEWFFQLVHPADREALRQAVAAAIREHRQFSVVHRLIRPDGEERVVHETAHIFFDETGEPVRMIGNAHDITDQRRAEETLRASEQRFREQATLLDKAQDAIIVRDLDHRTLYWNRSAERLYGWTAAEALGRPVTELVYRDVTPFLTAMEATLAQGEWMGEVEQWTRDGKSLLVEGRWTLVRDDEGRPKSILSINTDITDRKKLEQQFLRAQRMESIGTLAGGIAHDLNNVLAPILMSIDLLKMSATDARSLEILDMIGSSARRGADMVSQVLSFARGMEGRRIRVQVEELVRDVVKIIGETFPKNILVDTCLDHDLLSLDADPTQLHQVLLNLCVNARDAMPDGGRITLRASNRLVDPHYAGMNLGSTPGEYVRFEIEDTGSGMPPELIDQIFDPFFTTKEVGKGTGLGLSTAMAIVKSHGGFIQVYSDPGLGSRFSVYLPGSDGVAALAAPVRDQTLPRGNGETILVVDDEPSIRQVTRQTLEAFGYQVRVAADGTEAVAVFVEFRDEIAVVLTDMMMPLMDGPSLIKVLKRLDPQVKVIGASGITANRLVVQSMQAGVRQFLPKPYSAEVLLNALRKILSEKSA